MLPDHIRKEAEHFISNKTDIEEILAITQNDSIIILLLFHIKIT